MAPRPCSGAFEFVGKFVCARNAECSMPDNAVSCHCPAGYLGDAFKLGSGCVPTGIKPIMVKQHMTVNDGNVR